MAEMEDPGTVQSGYDVVTRSADRSRILTVEGPMSFDDAMRLADRAHAAASIAQVDVEPHAAPQR